MGKAKFINKRGAQESENFERVNRLCKAYDSLSENTDDLRGNIENLFDKEFPSMHLLPIRKHIAKAKQSITSMEQVLEEWQ